VTHLNKAQIFCFFSNSSLYYSCPGANYEPNAVYALGWERLLCRCRVTCWSNITRQNVDVCTEITHEQKNKNKNAEMKKEKVKE